VISALLLGRELLGAHFELNVVVGWLQGLGASSLAIPAYLTVFIVATTLLTPAVAMMLVGGVMWGPWPGGLIVWAVVNLAAHAQFALGRRLGRESVRSWLDRRRAGWIVRELESGGVLATLLIRQLPLPFVGVNVAAGASPIPFARWAAGNAIGLAIPVAVYTQLAGAIAAGAAGARALAAERAVYAAVAVTGLALVSRLVQRRFGRQVPVDPGR
jgi:uncharacterized membrane protein YdjX (TVP38/TMEM64 family)